MASDPKPFPSKSNDRAFYRHLRPVRWLFRALERLAPPVVGPLAITLFRLARRHATPSRELDWLASACPLDLEVDGRKVAAWSWGAGPAVLLVHGWEGRGSQMGAFAMALEDAGFRAIAVDAPGHGDSAGRLSSLPQFARTIRAAADAAGPIHAVVAHSFGAAGTGWALRGGLEAERLCFIAPPWDLQPYIDYFAELVGLSSRGLPRMLRQFATRFDAPWPEARFATHVAKDERPLLVVHDSEDSETPFEGGRRLAAAWENGRLHETSGLGHRRILRDRDVVAEVVSFVAGEVARQSPDRVERAALG
jgi:pimeloyl-ACP methyl ester carboxylesterase